MRRDSGKLRGQAESSHGLQPTTPPATAVDPGERARARKDGRFDFIAGKAQGTRQTVVADVRWPGPEKLLEPRGLVHVVPLTQNWCRLAVDLTRLSVATIRIIGGWP